MEVKFNINDRVRVKLHNSGLRILREAFPTHDFGRIQSVFGLDHDGWITLPMWQFMHIFGGHLADTAFDYNVMLLPGESR